MKKYRKRGFTLAEAMVVLVILAILAAIAIPTAIHYINLAEFRKNESNAKTVYLAAESALTWYRTSGEWEDFRKEVMQPTAGERNDTFDDADPEENVKDHRIYGITLDNLGKTGEGPDAAGKLVQKLLEDNAYDKDFFNAAITVEIDVETGQVYSAFYATRCDSLAYDGADTDGTLNISAADGNRRYENRRDRFLGYYSVEDVTNVVDLKPLRLKVSSINLLNSETLSLNWSSNSRHDNLDVEFTVTFYKERTDTADPVSEEERKLFSVTVNRDKLKTEQGWVGSSGQMASLEVKDKNDVSQGNWSFPLTYQATGSGQSARFSLVLDGMMSAELMETLAANASSVSEYEKICKAYSTSITRLEKADARLKKPQDIYAVVRVRPTYKNTNGDTREYRTGTSVKSNVENTLFVKGAKETGGKLEAKINRFRHLSNIRYYDPANEAFFTVTGRNMDWTSSGAGMYGLVETTLPGSSDPKMTAQWKDTNGTSAGGRVLDFPSIPLLSGKHVLKGENSDVRLSNLQLGADSMPDDADIVKIYKTSTPNADLYTRYLGLFCEVKGTVQNLRLQNPQLSLTGTGEDDAVNDYAHLLGAGILCGRSEGSLRNISVRSTDRSRDTVAVRLPDRSGSAEALPAGIGGLVGVLAKDTGAGSLDPLGTGAVVSSLTMEGRVTGKLPKPETNQEMQADPQEYAKRYSYGIGGIFGYANLDDGVTVEDCQNRADINGNLFSGGIGGSLKGVYGDGSDSVNIQNCYSDGLVLCQVRHEKEEGELEGRYFGGILGFGQQVQITVSSSASGRSSGYTYDSGKRDSLLGQYVGGIIGYGDGCRLSGCSTRKDGYVLGSDYVGGIAGGLSNNIEYVITGTAETAVTTNGGYVIGNRYVGGIVGENNGTGENGISKIVDCVNNGVAAGYDGYVGGIVGYNGTYGELENCVSYLSDYDHSMFNRIVNDWQTTGDCAGGLAGYNNGTIRFNDDAKATVKSVSGVVVGGNFVGGMIGFNDKEGRFDFTGEAYDLIGGQVYAFGHGAGGCIGLNASTHVLQNTLTIRPSSVTGSYYVGGCIGANVVDLGGTDVTMENFRTDNFLGTISGRAFTGGIIGYQRTYRAAQLGDVSLREQMLADARGNGGRFLPGLGEGNIPTDVEKSQDDGKLIIGNSSNSAESLSSSNNNIPLRASMYAGGIVGYCERSSALILRNCVNAGNILRLSTADAAASTGVRLSAYLAGVGMSNAVSEITEAEQEIAAENGRTEIQEADQIMVSMIGGMISSNLEEQVIDHCANTGSLNGSAGLGGIVGFNAGRVLNCRLQNNFGNVGMNYIGGIAGLNVRGDTPTYEYTDVENSSWGENTYGTIAQCVTAPGINISGRSYVGGIAGANLTGGRLSQNESNASVSAAGDYAGGIAGGNNGLVEASADSGNMLRTVNGSRGKGVGGIIGRNKRDGVLSVTASETSAEVIVVNSQVNITGREKVGGIIGINEGQLSASGKSLVCQAGEVRALQGYAGGIVGETAGDITNAVNQCARVTADSGPAGGIVAVNKAGAALRQCKSQGNVNSDQGYAGGIAAENQGTIISCEVQGTGTASAMIRSQESDGIGAVCAVNQSGAVIRNSRPTGSVELSGTAKSAGGIAGINKGTITGRESDSSPAGTMNYMPYISISSSMLTVGGAAGENQGTIEDLTAGLDFKDFSNYRYLGGITGRNYEGASVFGCSYSGGTMKEQQNSSAAGNCYGGIAGQNAGDLVQCDITNITMTIEGVYTATSTSTADQKESLSSHVGGIVGKNEESGRVSECRIAGGGNSITAGSGMAGGIVGYNKGTVKLSGSEETESLMTGVSETGIRGLIRNAEKNKDPVDSRYVKWPAANIEDKVEGDDANLERFSYSDDSLVTEGKTLQLIMSNNGNVGGITAYNASNGVVEYCATGNWYLNNKSDSVGVGTGGIIGMNESNQDLSFLLNQAFVGRRMGSGSTDRFAGGIIGNQNNTTFEGWRLQNCVNYGTVYCLNTHYSGGIMGQWTGTGGSIEKCYNYGNLQTTYEAGYAGAAGGIVAQLYHALEGNEYNIVGCRNYGSIYGRNQENIGNCANDSAGILGNVTTYKVNDVSNAQRFTIQVLDCVNGSGVQINSQSMASGIVGFFSCDDPRYDPANGSRNDGNARRFIRNSTNNINLNIQRCRNFAEVLHGKEFVGGILGERYSADKDKKNTILQDCYSVNRGEYSPNHHPIISYTIDDTTASTISGKNNYFMAQAFLNVNNADQMEADGNMVAIRSRVDTSMAFRYSTGGNQYVVSIDPAFSAAVSSGSIVVAEDQGLVYIRQADDTLQEAGKLLFKIDPQNTDPADNTAYDGMAAKIVNKGSLFDDHVRTAYHSLETANWNVGMIGAGITRKMEPPQKVALTRDGGRINIEITPAEGSDPFKYTAKLYVKNGGSLTPIQVKGKEEFTFYSENYSLELPEGAELLAGSLYLEVRACSMFDDPTDKANYVAPSDPADSEMTPEDKTRLPNPELRIELVNTGSGTSPYQYRFKVENEEQYREIQNADGTPFTDYHISVKFMDGTSELRIDPASGKLEADRDVNSGMLQQLLVQAVPNGEDSTFVSSAQVSLPAYLPKYTPSVSLDKNAGAQGGAGTSVPSFTFSGTNLSDLSITVTLDASKSGSTTTPPIYQADLIGTWTADGEWKDKDIVLKSTDILIASNGRASATFSNLDPEYMANVKDLKVRVWYASSGLGPVYTWHEADAAEAAELISAGRDVIATLTDVTKKNENGTETTEPVLEYRYSTILNDKATFDNYHWTYDTLLTWVGPPELIGADTDTVLTPVETNPLTYEFSWQMGQGQADPENGYLVTLKGVTTDAQGRERLISIETNQPPTTNRTIRVNAENWPYTEVELTVTCRGDEANKQIGLSSTGRYHVRTRLERPSQLSVANQDVNELNYLFQWAPIGSEDGCASYEIYMQKYKDDGSLEDPELLETVPVREGLEDGIYSKKIDLEPYVKPAAGEEWKEQKMLLYLVAQADPSDPRYVDSVAGVTYELTVPPRIKTPTVTWDRSWQYDPAYPLTTDSFQASDIMQSGGLKVTVRPDAGSLPPGDSSYLLKAYVFDSENNAENAKVFIETGRTEMIQGLLTAYPRDIQGNLYSAAMDVESGNVHSHILQGLSAQYAGKWALFYTRISSGDGKISSEWTANGDVWQLPYVKLTAPAVSDGSREIMIQAENLANPDSPVTEEWTADQTTVQWDQTELADAYDIRLQKKPASGSAAQPKPQDFRVEEVENGAAKGINVYWKKTDSNGDPVLVDGKQVWEQVNANAQGPGEDNIFTFELPGYESELNQSYLVDGDFSVPYKMTLRTTLEVKWEEGSGFHYTLVLPDADSLTTKDGASVVGEDFGLRITASAEIRSNVKENRPDGAGSSAAYVQSDPAEVSF